MLREALKLKGLEYPRDYKLLIIAGGSATNLAALQSGQISATTVAVPLNYAAEEAGFNVIGKLSDGVPYFQTNVIATRRSWAEKNRPVMVRFMRAMVESLRWLHETEKLPSTSWPKRCNSSQLTPARVGSFIRRIASAARRRSHDRRTQIQYPDLRRANRCQGTLPEPGKYVDQSYLSEALKQMDKR